MARGGRTGVRASQGFLQGEAHACRSLRLSVLNDHRPKARGRAAVVAPGARGAPWRRPRADDPPAAAL